MIPRVIHHVWVGGPIPAPLVDHIDTWQATHPNWDHRLWREADLDWLTNQEMFDRAEEITPHVGQLRADIARYEILHAFGGVYVDCDMESRKPLDPLMDDTCWAAWEDGEYVNNAMLASVPGHPLWADVIEALPASVRRNRRFRPNRMTGPHLFTPHALRHGITVHPADWFYPYLWSELDRAGEAFPDAYAVHHWANRRRRDGVDMPEVAHV